MAFLKMCVNRSVFVLIFCMTFFLSGCVGMVIDATTDAAIAVAKVPFKVGGAVVDVATGDDDEDEKKD